MKLVPIEVTNDRQIEAMRQIFNECLPFMTKPMEPVSPWNQRIWWVNLPKKVKRFKAFVYEDETQRGEILAYSLLQWHLDGRTTPLFGIRKGARGQNLARQIIQHYLKEAEGPLWGEERSDHAAIIKLNQEVGWKLLSEKCGVRYLYHPNDRRSFPDYQGMVEYWDSP